MKKRDIRHLKDAIAKLIAAVRKDHQQDNHDSQKVVNKVGQQVQSCENMPEIDTTKRAAAAIAKSRLDQMQAEVKLNSKGKVKYNLGDSKMSSALGVKAVTTTMTGLKAAFDLLLQKLTKVDDYAKLKTEESKFADEAKHKVMLNDSLSKHPAELIVAGKAPMLLPEAR